MADEKRPNMTEETETAIRLLTEASNELNREMLIARAEAIQAYANLEQALCALFAYVGGLNKRIAATIFFRISAFGSRRKILEELFREKFTGGSVIAFIASLTRWLAALEQERNEVVHWTVVTQIMGLTVNVRLRPPVFWSRPFDPERGDHKDSNQLRIFTDKCHFWELACLKFIDAVNALSPLDATARAAWLDIFQQQLLYPLPEDHLLWQMLRAQHNPPQSSPT
jgi:hypothetical protein